MKKDIISMSMKELKRLHLVKKALGGIFLTFLTKVTT